MADDTKQDAAKEMKANLGNTSCVAFSFDTTGSMQPCIAQVRQKLRDLVEMMTQDIPGVKIGLIAHGDYCDGPKAVTVLDLTDNLEAIMNFINTAPNTGGGDAPEAYELALARAVGMSWPAEGGSLVLIGDEVPHDTNYPQNTDKLDWKEQINLLKAKNVNVFPMQCLKRPGSSPANKFYEDVSQLCDTPLLILENFNDASAALGAVAYASAGAGVYEGYMKNLADCGEASASNVENFNKLRGFTSRKSATPPPATEEKADS